MQTYTKLGKCLHFSCTIYTGCRILRFIQKSKLSSHSQFTAHVSIGKPKEGYRSPRSGLGCKMMGGAVTPRQSTSSVYKRSQVHLQNRARQKCRQRESSAVSTTDAAMCQGSSPSPSPTKPFRAVKAMRCCRCPKWLQQHGGGAV